MAIKKERLDVLVVQKELVSSRNKASAMIMAAEVFVNGQIADKPGMRVPVDADITLKSKPRYVGRGGIKLEGALTAFDVDIQDKICADVGASTGGFTDCLLQHGASRVYAIDVARGIIDYRIRIDERVVLLENTNARYLEELDELVSLVVVDVSFISLRLILPAIQKWLTPEADIITLVKPQFEAGKTDVGKGGIIKDPNVRKRVLEEITTFAEESEFNVIDLIRSPITGQKGNTEYLMWLKWGHQYPRDLSYVKKIPSLAIVD
jgi:23S rRNA (cytidine1920-2'-O)/16S rRNA (cytidine1409-2'-O)-methyltransferase